jgi:hypothetical protein
MGNDNKANGKQENEVLQNEEDKYKQERTL